MKSTHFTAFLYLNILTAALLSGLICHFAVHLPALAQYKYAIMAGAVLAYLAIAISTNRYYYYQIKRIDETNEARATILSALDDLTLSGPNAPQSTLLEIASKLAEQTEALRQGQQAIINFSRDLIFSLDEELRILELNSNAEKIHLHKNLSLLGSSFINLFHSDDRQKLEQYLNSCKSNEANTRCECRLVNAIGKILYFQLSAEWSPSKKKFYCIAADITAEKEIERLRAEITAMISHDLRAPISSLSYIIDGLIAGEYGTLNSAGKEGIGKVRDGIDQILRLVNQLLDAERLEAGCLEADIKVIPSSSFIEAAINILSPAADRKELKITVSDSDHFVFADFEKCVQILSNLLSNSIKFAPRSSEIKVVTREDNDFIRVEVSDHGCGIPVDSWGIIFERFKSASSPNQSESGAGLGLYIAKQLTELQGGQIGLYSVLGEGSTFWIKLRRASESDLPGYLE